MSIILYFIPYAYLFVCFIKQLNRKEHTGNGLQKSGVTFIDACGLLVTLLLLGGTLYRNGNKKTAKP